MHNVTVSQASHAREIPVAIDLSLLLEQAVALDRHEAPLGDEGPASVPRLPPELLHKIFACVAQIESPAYPKTSSARATLAVVSRSCSTFHSIALPLLWHSVDIRSRRDARSVARAIRVDETTQERASFVSEVRLRTEEMLGPPHEHATTDLCRLLDTVELLRVEQRWFGLELLGGFTGVAICLILCVSFCAADDRSPAHKH